MKLPRKGCLIPIAVLILVGLTGLLLLIFVIGPQRLEQKRILEGPPTVLVSSPRGDETVPPASPLMAQATVTATRPIARVELWLDGELVTTQQAPSAVLTTYHSSHLLNVSEGSHMLYWRAVDSAGLVGQSDPIGFLGGALVGGQSTEIVMATGGESLADLAQQRGVDPQLMETLNPGLGPGGLPESAPVVIPGPAGGTGESPTETTPNAPTPPLPKPPMNLAALTHARPPAPDLISVLPGLFSSFPAAPSDLQVGLQDCRVRLLWNDNATDETHLIVWSQALGGPLIRIETLEARPGTGPAWFEFEAPSFGIHSFWVEAHNALGSQSSPIEWLAINDAQCGREFADKIEHLEIQALGVRGALSGGWNKVYCYLSLEGQPERRIPEDDSAFLQPGQFGAVNLAEDGMSGPDPDLLLMDRRITVPMPTDGELLIEGSCWGWRGDSGPFPMGEFSQSVPQSSWDGRRLDITAANYTVTYIVRPRDPALAAGAYGYLDLSMARPYDLAMSKIDQSWSDPRLVAQHAHYPRLSWRWDGELDKISSFSIYLNGALTNTIANPRQALKTDAFGRWFSRQLSLPSSCGGYFTVAVTAETTFGRSEPSAPLHYQQPPCEYYAQLTFEQFMFETIDDGQHCDPAEISIHVWVNDQVRAFSAFEQEARCNVAYPFSQFAVTHDNSVITGDPNTFLIPISLTAPQITIAVLFEDGDWVGEILADWDPLCAYHAEIVNSTMSPEAWEQYSFFSGPVECGYAAGKVAHYGPGEYDAEGELIYRIHGTVSPAEPTWTGP